MNSKLLRLIAALLSFSLVAAACGSSTASDDDGAASDDTASSDDSTSDDSGDDEATAEDDDEAMEDDDDAMAEGLATEGSVDIAVGTTLNLDECPDDWSATTGVDGDEIRFGWSGPQTGALAGFGAIGEGMSIYFDYINATDPIGDQELVLVQRDDAYEAGRTVANLEEMLDTEDIFAFAHLIGTPNNVAARPVTQENCVPQLFNSSGFPLWGDPANFPWTVGNILNYATETEIWCAAIKAEFGDGATVAGLFMNNDFGKTYQLTFKASPACAGLELVGDELHDPAGDTIQNEMTTLASTGADVLLGGTTSKFCSQSTAVLAATEWRPRVYMSYTCNNLSAFFEPVKDAAAALGAGNGVHMANSNKICGDPSWADDAKIQLIESILVEYGNVTCADGSFSTGILYGEMVVDVLRDAAAMEGGLNRVNMMAAVWNADYTNDSLLGGTLKLDGTNDAYWTEAAQIQEIQVVDGSLVFVAAGDLIDAEGQGGSYAG